MRAFLPALAIVLCLAACGGGGNNTNTPPPPPVPDTATGCSENADYLNTIRYNANSPGPNVGYAVMLQEFCAGSTTTGLVPTATILQYFADLYADSQAYNGTGVPQMPPISEF